MLRDKNILIVSPEPWGHIFISKHHYSVYLAKRGNRVFFLNPPGRKNAVEETAYSNVFSLHYTGWPRGLRFFSKTIRRYFVRKVYRTLERMCSCQFDIIWSFDNSVFFDFDTLPKAVVKITHIVDLNQHFETARAASTADYCFCTTDIIRNRLLQFNPRVSKILHGCHVPACFNRIARTSTAVRVVYSGNLAMPSIDWIVLDNIVGDNATTEFCFIGPGNNRFDGDVGMNDAKRRVLAADNTKVLGTVSSDMLQGYYRSADLLIIAYREEFHAYQANPHKMMEYLASGKMIVSSYCAEYSDLSKKGLIMMSDRNAEFPECFSRALKELPRWNTEVLGKERQQFAGENTYDKQIDRIEQIIEYSKWTPYQS